MKHKTWFRLVLKAIGVLLIGISLPGLANGIGLLLMEYVSGGAFFGRSYSWAWLIGSGLQMLMGVYLLVGGSWIVNKAIPSNRAYCPECGYDISRNTGDNCPECGTALPRKPDTRLAGGLAHRGANDHAACLQRRGNMRRIQCFALSAKEAPMRQATMNFVLLLALITLPGCGGSNQASQEEQENTQISVAAATPSRPRSSEPNAADEYRRIHERIGKNFLEPLDELELDRPPTASEAQFLIANQALIKEIIEATRIARCDSGFNVSDAAKGELPQFASFRTFARLLRYDAHRLINKAFGPPQASERLSAILRIAGHCGQEPWIVGKLVGYACTNLAVEMIQASSGKFTEAKDQAMLVAELRALQAGPLADSRSALKNELVLTKQAIESGEFIYGFGPEDRLIINAAEKGPLLAEVERVITEIERVWDEPSAQSRIKQIESQIRVPKAKGLLPVFAAFKKTEERFQSQLAGAIYALERSAR